MKKKCSLCGKVFQKNEYHMSLKEKNRAEKRVCIQCAERVKSWVQGHYERARLMTIESGRTIKRRNNDRR